MLQSLTNVSSTMEHQMESSKVGVTAMSDRLDTKEIQLIQNFPNISGN